MPTVLVTGANRGIGLALAAAYAARGDAVIATARSPEKSSALNELARDNGHIRIVALDVTDEAALQRLSASLKAEPVDIVICNSGIMGSRGGTDAAGYDAAEWARMMATNVTGAFLTARALLPSLARAKAGKLAFISTQMASSSLASGDCYSYRASKAAMANVGLNLSIELKPRGIAVGIYHPGWVKTDMGGKAAQITAEASAGGLVRRIDALSIATTGVFEDYSGKPFSF
jgi:NAD(P)-dependent dehydrogenase (short-subunit alcohol dehydrogenase family)